jgi:hypothetical protein
MPYSRVSHNKGSMQKKVDFSCQQNEPNFKEVTSNLHVCTVHQQYQSTFLFFQLDAHRYKITEILKKLKFRQLLRHVSVHAGTINRKLFSALLKTTVMIQVLVFSDVVNVMAA